MSRIRKKSLFCLECRTTTHAYLGKEMPFDGCFLARGMVAVVSLGMSETPWAERFWQCEERWMGMFKKLLFLSLLLSLLLVLSACSKNRIPKGEFRDKVDFLWECVQQSWEAPNSPPARDAGYVVFFSISDGAKKASVRSAQGRTLEDAWWKAAENAYDVLGDNQKEPIWVKVDIVDSCEVLTGSQLVQELRQCADCSYRKGLSFDRKFDSALLEEELNGSLIYNYEYDDIDVDYLNAYYEKNGRKPLEKAPSEYIVFQCHSWFCDEDNDVYELSTWGQNKGQRRVEVDAELAHAMITGSVNYLSAQVLESGKFVYNYYPQYDMDAGDYNIVRHAGAIWSMIQGYSLSPNESLASAIKRALDYLAAQVVYDGSSGYVFEEETGEIKLGSCGVAVLAFVEYQTVFCDDSYQELCLSLGEGILSLLDEQSGTYYHILNRAFERIEETRTVYYDGEATYALCRLYELTCDEKYLDAAKSAVDHFIEADYTQYRDHWVAYSMNEITKYIQNNPDYWDFALRNALENLNTIEGMNSAPTNFELLMNTFETYIRMPDSTNMSREEKEALFNGISLQTKKSAGEFFYPEYAMYMANPRYILNSFMMRDAGFRTRIDDVQHSIGGFFLFQENYDKMIELGFPDAVIE